MCVPIGVRLERNPYMCPEDEEPKKNYRSKCKKKELISSTKVMLSRRYEYVFSDMA